MYFARLFYLFLFVVVVVYLENVVFRQNLPKNIVNWDGSSGAIGFQDPELVSR